ncbi:MAG: tetratricopeptide repeat protein [Bacteroidota bacterium]
MKNWNKVSFLFLFFSFFSPLCESEGRQLFAQNKNIDSLQLLLSSDKVDTNRIIHSNELSFEYINSGLYDSALYYANSALRLARQLQKNNNKNESELFQIKKGITNSYSNIGTVYYYLGNYSKTLDYWLKSLKIAEEQNDKKAVAARIGNIGIVYANQADYPKALECYFKALTMNENLGDKKGVIGNLSNIGVIKMRQGNYPQALEYYLKSLKISEELQNEASIANALGNIGIIYNTQNDYPKALQYFLKSLEIAKLSNDKNGIVSNFSNIGDVYYNQKEYSTALEYYLKALKITEELGNKVEIGILLGNVGDAYKQLGNYPQALDYAQKALKISSELGDKRAIATNLVYIGAVYLAQKKYQNAYEYLYPALALDISIGANSYTAGDYETLSELYEKSNIPLPDSIGGKLLNMEQMRLRSVYYYKRCIAIRDALFNEENKKQLVQKEMNYEFEKKEQAAKAEQSKKDAVLLAEKNKQQFILILVSSLLILVFLFAGFVARSLRMTRKQKRIIEEKNKETEIQKGVIEKKNKDITDSIRYAKRIQDALLREEEHVSMHLPEHFILFIPKDIVSGDFYWGAEKQDHWYFAVGDCTGHGVPGAIMCMLGISFLNDIVSPEGLLSPAEILNRLRDKMVKELRQNGEDGGNQDGMDISLVRLNLKTNEVQWAGANNALNLIRDGVFDEIKADKQPVGFQPGSRLFTNHEMQLKKGDSIYIFSDGYADQFGGEKGKKYTYRKLENSLAIYNHKAMKDQKGLLRKRFLEWKGPLEQVDDVCVFGVRL